MDNVPHVTLTLTVYITRSVHYNFLRSDIKRYYAGI
jgi:hypothetical protein